MALQKGDKAPSFKLVDTDKKEVSLEDFKGKILILHFFPAAFTGTCTAQLCAIRDGIGMYHNDKADVVAVSVDSVFSLIRFKAEQNLNFTVLSDFNKEVSKAYGVLLHDFVLGMKDVSHRSVFLIDGNGIIQYSQMVDKQSDMPDFEALNAALAGLTSATA